jgi:hypothetical protein
MIELEIHINENPDNDDEYCGGFVITEDGQSNRVYTFPTLPRIGEHLDEIDLGEEYNKLNYTWKIINVIWTQEEESGIIYPTLEIIPFKYKEKLPPPYLPQQGTN